MKTCFADPAHCFALFSANDAFHSKARELQAQRRRIVTTEWVLTEVADGFSSPPNRPTFLGLVRSLRRARSVEIVPASTELFDQGCKFYAERNDKSWSLTDCISFVVMLERGITEALTSVRHFEQAGFVALLREGHTD